MTLVVDLGVPPPLGPLVAEVDSGTLVRVAFGVWPTAVTAAAVGEGVVVGEGDQATLAALRAGLDRWVDTGRDDYGIALDFTVVGHFRRTVYRELLNVGPGDRVTYGELARRVGRRGAARAVGQAMATNPWPLVVPCHRVVPADGGVGHYAGGAERKAWMLAVEQAGGATQVGP